MDDLTKQDSLWHYKMTPGTGFVITLLVLALVALGERVLYDLGRLYAPLPLDYFQNLSVIVVHSFFIIPLLIVSIIVNALVGHKKEKYAIVLIPYFVLSIVLALQLILQIAIYFGFHHTSFQFYVVMTVLVAVCTIAIFYIQDKYNPKKT
ncbi:MAG: hypothetical protein A3J07_02585 [Candidatus Doudnabacteria bacterium RIFCSPLOWO2_02_FULL_49_13]|uniref:Uncharacterized protein n=1 Tax=Candidatus Doudnabacteria bacterium RIFCSPHIGHO2_12_FULL_48_16 TaxID=1817838 RepID=A0A1F5PKX6_9BACT|nr:MAG: hypothetical protein A3B77_01235 [Candidatus Doudnabacteria bacterium RIFCSPHIGHO2_02_FULL_49_24]OGE89085.1 MAG: hypothetical protein A2760_02945 [Candidatus Doudnabacteria bacterium RIFCSPHIGHO2_01_FULL_50_67]OGE90566.1 MAG: hypothetical protein A3E29_02100 [Candidatus Doudnabacteria bacterium RIFCSPHIGHO2_12_FULL_48_16]OGE97603.1 MAG: hypothetical protein A2990_03155 [Candidatus Doudnabacteria bacterium RIFCSPLOWO2_01_FULL_49_40]OGF02958.1 MAG: hypothetical protein A3J07_02585 [Candid